MKRKNKQIGVITGGKSSDPRQEHDFYPTPSASTQALIDTGVLDGCKAFRDPCAGRGHITDVLGEHFTVAYNNALFAEDLIDYGANHWIETGVDFLKAEPYKVEAIVTNPPYSRDILMPFVDKCLAESTKITAMFLKITFLESTARKEFFDTNKTLKYIMPFSNRQPMYKNGEVVKGKSNAIMYAWFIWDKTYNGEPTIKLLDNSELVKENKSKGVY